MTADFYRQLAEKATELLGDGEWHPHEKVMRALMKLVPPGPALRRSEQDRLAWTRQHGHTEAPPRKRPRSTEDQIYSGQRGIVRDFLSNKGVFESNRSGSPHGGSHDRQIRMIGRHTLVAEGRAPEIRAQLEEEIRDLRRELSQLKRKNEDLQQMAGELRDCLTLNGLRDKAVAIVSAYQDWNEVPGKGKRGRR